MNHETFQSGEQTSDHIDDNTVEYPSFDEHMRELEEQEDVNQEDNRVEQQGSLVSSIIERAKRSLNRILNRPKWAEYNYKELTRPSLKNEKLSEGQVYINKGITNASNKIQQGEPLNSEDILGLLSPGLYFDGAQEVFDNIGLEKGQDFDVDLPKYLYDQDGKMYKSTDLSVSFRNPNGMFTRMIFSEGNDGLQFTAISGSREACDVGYRGEAKQSLLRNTSLIEVATFDYGSRSVKNVVVPSAN